MKFASINSAVLAATWKMIVVKVKFVTTEDANVAKDSLVHRKAAKISTNVKTAKFARQKWSVRTNLEVLNVIAHLEPLEMLPKAVPIPISVSTMRCALIIWPVFWIPLPDETNAKIPANLLFARKKPRVKPSITNRFAPVPRATRETQRIPILDATKWSVSPTPIVPLIWLVMLKPKDVLTLAIVSLAARVHAELKTTNPSAIANLDSNPLTANVWILMNVPNLDPATLPLSAETHPDPSHVPVRKAALAMLAFLDANLAVNAWLTAIALQPRLVVKAVVSILVSVSVVKVRFARSSAINLSAHAHPEPKATQERCAASWNVWKIPNVPWADLVFPTSVLTLVA